MNDYNHPYIKSHRSPYYMEGQYKHNLSSYYTSPATAVPLKSADFKTID